VTESVADSTAEETQTGEDHAPEDPPAPTAEDTEAKRAGPTTVMLLGSGELGRELVLAFQRLGAFVIAVDRYAGAPAHAVADRAVVVKMNDPDELAALFERESPHYVVTDSGFVAADALTSVSERGDVQVVPTARTARLSLDREGMRRLAADELGLPTAPFWFAGSIEELTAVADHAGLPLVVKPVVAVPGQGQSVVLRHDDIEAAWERAVTAGRIPQNRVLAETIVEIDYEVTLLTVRTEGPTGPVVHFCEPIGHREVNGDILEAWQPQAMSDAARDVAKSIAARIVNALSGRGVFGVELQVHGDEVYFADVTSRPHDSGLVTLRSQRLSGFELHARAILGLPVDTIMISPAAAEIAYAETGSADPREDGSKAEVGPILVEALAVPESDVRLFGHSETDSRHRLGVALATAPDVGAARERAHEVSTALHKLW
jgi:phosphoribosylglycinamide formyltransferase 2